MRPIKDFIAEIKNDGLARSNRFTVNFALPPQVQQRSIPGSTLAKILLFCDSTQMPGVNLATTPARTFGELREMAYERLFEGINMTFYMDKALTVKQLFEDWMHGIINPIDRTFNYYKDYTTDVDIIVYDVNDGTRYKVTLHEAYPKAISAIDLNYASKDIMKLQVSWVYKFYMVEQLAAVDTKDPFDDRFTLSINNGQRIPIDYLNDFKSFQGKYNRFVENVRQDGIVGTVKNVSTELGITEVIDAL